MTTPTHAQLDSTDEERSRRASNFVRIIIGMTVISVVPQLAALPFFSPAERVIIAILLLTSLVFNTVAVVLARRGKFEAAGFTITSTMLATFLLITWGDPPSYALLGWIFPLAVLIPSNVLAPRSTLMTWIAAQLALIAASGPYLMSTGLSREGLLITILMSSVLAVFGYMITAYSYSYHATVRRLEEARAEAAQASMAKSSFLASMSHELRTPLNAILGYAEMLTEDFEAQEPEHRLVDDEHLDDISRIHASGIHLLELINDVLDLSKIEAGRLVLEVRPVEVDALLDEVQAATEPLFSPRTNDFVLDVPDPLGVVHTDSLRLKQVLLNLLSNAAKFTFDGTITLGARRVDDSIEFSVRDTGVGLSQEAMARVFDAFEQADSSTSRRFGGTGLGLALCKELCHHLGGTITVESALGEGATFTFSILDQR